MAMAVKPVEAASQCVILHGVSWATYERLLEDFEDRHAAHFTYDQGSLEIRVPSIKHEEPNRVLASLVDMLALEWDIDMRNLGSTTFKREDLARGFEPDTCFYIERVAQIRGKDDLDLTVNPPPDLVIEVDITHPSLDKLPLYAAIGVTEVWRYNGTSVTIYTLTQDAYTSSETSHVLPGITSAVLMQFISESRELRRPDWLRRVRQWAQSQANP
ncbi:Uma2 family endonuclease [Candidatus Entotheonella palauensis]|uniref:Uma2 family endonuclease n=1 Tax=Candidatus Entotheonella palauensis TaxID=93172 RepID=UPI000B7EBCEC|nr:Uma2 family endonuclease [Candidatus Entotheonella palauensis]